MAPLVVKHARPPSIRGTQNETNSRAKRSLLSPSVAAKPPPVRWVLPDSIDPLLTRRLMDATGVSPWVAEVLARRGFVESEQLMTFLQPRLRGLSDPFLLPGMSAA